MRKSYLVNQFSQNPGDIVIRESGKGYLTTPEEVSTVAQSLLKLAETMQQKQGAKFDQHQYRKERAEALAFRIGLYGQWLYNPDGIALDTLSDLSAGVYFARTAAYPNAIKIGATADPARRMGELTREHFRETFMAVAYCAHPRYMDLEKYLHYQFEEHRIFSEFFLMEPVMWYLSYLQQVNVHEQKKRERLWPPLDVNMFKPKS